MKNNKIYTIVEMYQGIVSGVVSYLKEENAEKHFEEYTGINYNEYKKRIKTEDDDYILGDDYTGTVIFEHEIKV